MRRGRLQKGDGAVKEETVTKNRGQGKEVGTYLGGALDDGVGVGTLPTTSSFLLFLFLPLSKAHTNTTVISFLNMCVSFVLITVSSLPLAARANEEVEGEDEDERRMSRVVTS